MNVLLVVYDNSSYIHFFPQGTAYIAAALRQKGHSVTIFNQDVHHYPDEMLTRHLDENDYDVVGIGVIAGYWQYRRLMSLARAVNAARKRPFFVMGGHGPSPDPAYFMRKTGADAVVLGEGEETAVDLLDALERRRPLSEVQGIAWRDGAEVKINPRRPLIADLSTIPWPAYDLFPIHYYRLYRFPGVAPDEFTMPVLSGRGCTFTCNFCYRMDTGFRPRPHDDVLDEVEMLQQTYGINYIIFSDELLMSSKPRTIEFAERILERGLKFKWACNGRLNYATPEVLQVMKRAGCVFITYGIEAMDDQVLKNMRKALRVDQIIPGVRNTLEAGISPGLAMLFGNIGDNEETLEKAVDFLLEYDDHAQLRTIRPVTPYPGTPLFNDAVKMGLIKDVEDFYENKHLNSDLMCVNFTDLSEDRFYEALRRANTRLLEKYYEVKKAEQLELVDRLYGARDASFRGFRHT